VEKGVWALVFKLKHYGKKTDNSIVGSVMLSKELVSGNKCVFPTVRCNLGLYLLPEKKKKKKKKKEKKEQRDVEK